MREDADDTAKQTSQQHSSEQSQLSNTQAALRHAVQQLDELAGSSNDIQEVRAQLEQQTQALQSMEETIATAEADKAREHEQTLSR